MFLGDTLRVLLRRWAFLCAGLVLTAYGGWWMLAHVESDYQASGQMVFLLPPDAGGKVSTNPYLNLQGGLSTTAALVAGNVLSPDTQAELAAQGLTAEYNLAVSPGTGPLLVVTTKDKDPAIAVATRDAVMVRVTETLAEIQAGQGIPERQTIETRSSAVDVQAEVLPGSRLRALAGTVGAGVLLVLVATFALDRALARRRTQRRPPEPTEPPRAAPSLEAARERAVVS